MYIYCVCVYIYKHFYEMGREGGKWHGFLSLLTVTEHLQDSVQMAAELNAWCKKRT